MPPDLAYADRIRFFFLFHLVDADYFGQQFRLADTLSSYSQVGIGWIFFCIFRKDSSPMCVGQTVRYCRFYVIRTGCQIRVDQDGNRCNIDWRRPL